MGYGINCPGFDEAFTAYIEGVKELVKYGSLGKDRSNGEIVTIEIDIGPRYIRVVKRDPPRYGVQLSSVHTFVDRTNGNILKGSWKSPVRNGVRGSILSEDHGLSKVNWHGAIYLR